MEDNELMVFGTKNLRLVDASILPTQVGGHLTSTLYALAERAADIDKKSNGSGAPDRVKHDVK